MAPAVPFALLGVVQLAAVAAWLGLAGAVCFPRLRRRVTPVFVLGALAMAAADAYTAARIGPSSSDPVGWLRVVGLGLLALGAAGGSGQSQVLASASGPAAVVVPLGARPTPAVAAAVAGLLGAGGAWWRMQRPNADRLLAALLGTGLLLAGAAAALAEPARDARWAAIAVLAVRGASSLALIGALVLLTRLLLVGKIVGAIAAGVVTMAVAAVAVVGTSVASQVQDEQSQRLLQIAQGEQASLLTLQTRAGLFARVVLQCPQRRDLCVSALRLFAEQPDYFGVVAVRGKPPVVVAPDGHALSRAALLQLAGSPIVREALQRHALPQVAPSGVVLLSGSPPKLAVVAAVPGRPNASTDVRLPVTYAAVYGVGLVDAYLKSERGHPAGYDVTLLADGQVIASSLGPTDGKEVLAEAQQAEVENADPSVQRVVPAEGGRPSTAFVPITGANGDVRVATLALSQPANEALAAQRGVLQRLFITALIALVIVSLLAILLAQRIAEPVRRLTVAAGRVRRGDLDATTTIPSRDEVGVLSRAFDAMTASLRGATDELRRTAVTEAELRARLETVVASMSDGLVVTDARGIVTVANPTALRLLGLEEAAVVGRKSSDVLTVRDDEGRDAVMPRAGRIVEAALVRQDGNTVPVRVGNAPLGDGQGRVIVLADRTREYEVDRMKSEFLANISHELRTPLTPIRGYAEILARRPELSRKQVESFLDEILTSTGRMSRAVELLVDVAALEGGRIEPMHSRVTVRSFVDERVEAWKQRYPERAADFKRRVSAKLPAVDIDRHWVSRALDEFADNAVKYTEPGTPITVVAVAEGSDVRVAVRDAGPGFDPKRAEELVADFSQADASETRTVGGLGIGLGFVNRVAERFRLQLTIETEPGKGSEFGLILPAAPAR